MTARPHQAFELLEALARRPPLPYAARGPDPQGAVRALLAALDDPQRGLPAVHLAGSKGKGSTALMVEAVLQAAGLRIGTFTSPHLARWNERIRIAGRAVDDAMLERVLARLRPRVESACEPAAVSLFDVLVACALRLFRDSAVDIVVVETGIGGRLDATAVVEPVACAITTIELEHVDRLGPDITAIAGHKAGILRPGVPVAVGELPPEALAVIEAEARTLGSPIMRLGQEIRYRTQNAADGSQTVHVQLADRSARFRLGVPGRHQAANAALALACTARILPAGRWRSALAALAGLRLPGRCQVLGRHPWIIADSAHTHESLLRLGEILQTFAGGPRQLLISLAVGKDPGPLIEALPGPFRRITVTRVDPLRSQPAAPLARHLRRRLPEVPVHVREDPRRALREAVAATPPEGILVITGSVYLAGFAATHLARTHRNPPPAP